MYETESRCFELVLWYLKKSTKQCYSHYKQKSFYPCIRFPQINSAVVILFYFISFYILDSFQPYFCECFVYPLDFHFPNEMETLRSKRVSGEKKKRK